MDSAAAPAPAHAPGQAAPRPRSHQRPRPPPPPYKALYRELRATYRRPSRPSGLTLVDSVAVKSSKSNW